MDTVVQDSAQAKLLYLERNPLQKYFDSLEKIRKLDGDFVLAGASRKIDGDVLYAVWENLDFLYGPEIRPSELRRYLKKRGLPAPEGRELVYEGESTYDGSNAKIVVNGLASKTWGNRTKYEININSILSGNEERCACATLTDIEIVCGCTAGEKLSKKTPPSMQNRLPRSPTVAVDAIIDHHTDIALNYLVSRFGAYDLELFGYPAELVKLEKVFIRKVLANRENWNLRNYQLNEKYRGLQEKLFKPLRERIRLCRTRQS